MSNPIVQIKRGVAPSGWLEFDEILLKGELCDIYDQSIGAHRLFIGDNTRYPILLNPIYNTETKVTNAASGFTINLDLYNEKYYTNSVVAEKKSSHTITIPPAGENAAVGLITNGSQIIAGDKSFTGSILPSNTSATIGTSDNKWGNIFATNFLGNASTASKFASTVKINDTDFDGSAGITTNTWGAERNISISGTANADAANGTNINGSNVNGYVLQIPDTMTGFTSITTTTLLPTNSTGSALGSSTNIWTDFYVKNPRIYNAEGNRYIQL